MPSRTDLLAMSAIAKTLAYEGGFVNDPVDPGGATHYGISLRWLHTQNIDFDLDGDGDVDVIDVRAMTVEQAVALYLRHWWEPFRCGELPDLVGAKYFDMIVNMGPHAGGCILQRAANVRLFRRRQDTLTIDGIVGSVTLEAVNTLCQGEAELTLLNDVRRGCEQFYCDLIHKNSEFAKYKKGWLRRAKS